MRDSPWSNTLLTGNSKWRQMSLEKKKPISWLQDVKLKEKSNLWIKSQELNNLLLKSKYMQNFGCLIKKRKCKENIKKLMKRELRFRKPLISLHGRQILEHKTNSIKKVKLFVNKTCWNHNGLKKLKPTRIKKGKNSY